MVDVHADAQDAAGLRMGDATEDHVLVGVGLEDDDGSRARGDDRLELGFLAESGPVDGILARCFQKILSMYIVVPRNAQCREARNRV
jgi:hypothetical protein